MPFDSSWWACPCHLEDMLNVQLLPWRAAMLLSSTPSVVPSTGPRGGCLPPTLDKFAADGSADRDSCLLAGDLGQKRAGHQRQAGASNRTVLTLIHLLETLVPGDSRAVQGEDTDLHAHTCSTGKKATGAPREQANHTGWPLYSTNEQNVS